MSGRRGLLVTLVSAVVAGSAPAAAAPPVSYPQLANHCFAVSSADVHGRFFLKPTVLGKFMLYDGRQAPAPEWAIARRGANRFRIRATEPGAAWKPLTVRRARGCRPYPEAALGARGATFRGRRRDGTVLGWADPHMHVTANLRAGGLVISGQSFNRLGITEALGRDADVHGSDGSLDITGNLLRSGNPLGSHDTHGWPSFAGWPTYDTYTHQQVYWRWLERAWRSGLRLLGAQLVEDEPLCDIEPRRSHSCDEMDTIELEVKELRGLQDYVDAQFGGRGRGFLRIVRDPRSARRVIEQGKLAVIVGVESSNPFGCSVRAGQPQCTKAQIDAQFGGRGRGFLRIVRDPRSARRVIEQGKLAVIVGVESSNPFGCSVRAGQPQCTKAQIDAGIDRLYRLGVRTVFPAHWVDNALAGAALEGGDKGTFISAMQLSYTGGPFATGPCPEQGQGEDGPLGGKQCNTRGLTDLGEYAINRLIDKHMLIEADHLSERARLKVLDIAERRHYPLVSSHTNTGGFWTADDLRRLYGLGGISVVTSDDAKALPGKILALRRYRSLNRTFGVGLGTDTGGFAALPGPQPGVSYPFRAYRGKVVFSREQTGSKTYDVTRDGVAHYGLLPDLLAAVQAQPHGREALGVLFHSAEAYLEMWERASV